MRAGIDSGRGRVIVSLERIDSLDRETREGIGQVLAAGFDDVRDPEAALEPFFSRMPSMFVARQGRRVVGFQFYRFCSVSGRGVHHFSLAARLPGSEYRGVQAQFGRFLVARASLKSLPWKGIYLAGVTNSPRSYANMHAAGGTCFPDVRQQEQSNPFGEFYGEVATTLGFPDPGPAGILTDRMDSLGFALRAEAGREPAIAPAYDAYVRGRRQDGIFVLIELVPLRDFPRYVWRAMRAAGSTASARGALSGGTLR